MHNAPRPKLEDLPSKTQLRRSSLFAGIGAVAIGVMVYMPAEFGRDPTGVGTILGLTEMGEIKQQLAKEAAARVKKLSKNQGSWILSAFLFPRNMGDPVLAFWNRLWCWKNSGV